MYYTYDTENCNENENQHVFTIEYDEMYNSNNFVSKMKKSTSKLIQTKLFDSKNEKFDVNEIIAQRFFAIDSITIFANSKYDSKLNVDQSTRIYTIKIRKKKKRMKYNDDVFDVKKKFATKSFEFIEKISTTTFVKKKKKIKKKHWQIQKIEKKSMFWKTNFSLMFRKFWKTILLSWLLFNSVLFHFSLKINSNDWFLFRANHKRNKFLLTSKSLK